MKLIPLKHAWRTVVPDISIVVPTMNEADNVLLLAGRIRLALSGRKVEVIFIDDSPDLTTSQAIVSARALCRTPRFHVRFFHRTGQKRWGGLSGSVVDGIKRARAATIIVMDGDLQHPPEVLPKLLEASEGHDVVVASRYRDGGSAGGLSNGVRRLASRGSTYLAKRLFPHRLRQVSDPMTGFFLVKRDAIQLERLHPNGFKILLEILGRHRGLRVSEISFQFGQRLSGESKFSPKMVRQYLAQLLTIKRANAADAFCRLPRTIRFGIVGGGVFALGMAALFYMVEYLGVPVLLANAVQLVLTFWLNYVLNRSLTWRDRQVSKRAAAKFLISRAATTLLNFYLFAWLVVWQTSVTVAGQTYDISVHYVLANVITLAVITLINFLVSDRWAFAQAQARIGLPKYLPTTLIAAAIIALLAYLALQSVVLAVTVLFVLISMFMFVQASVEVWRMTYGYRNPEAVDTLRFPTPLAQPGERFCVIVPARHEAEVLGATLHTLAKQTHPHVAIVAVICDDDPETLEVAHAATGWRTGGRVEVLEYPLPLGAKPSKPRQLNYAMEWVKDRDFTVVGVIDAEDTVHPQLLAHVDAAFADRSIGVVQGGVQLMDFDSSWYSLHNVLEYWRWYTSSMLFQAEHKFMPLGGNTVFVRRRLLKRAHGWPLSLTEDCALGVRLSSRFRAKTAVYYEPRLATQEETPDSLRSFFRQRVRWFQGFFGEWRRGHWRQLPRTGQRLLAMYVLGSPLVLAFGGLAAIAATVAFTQLKAPVVLTMLTYLPFVPLMLLLVLHAVALHDFGQAYSRQVRLRHYATLFITFIPYLMVLNAAAVWSMLRELRGDTSWQKTAHRGRHRVAPAAAAAVPEEL